MNAGQPATLPATRQERERDRRARDRFALARRHAELVQAVRQLRLLSQRLEGADADPHSRRLAAAIVGELDALVPDVLVRESRAVLPVLAPDADAWLQQAADQWRADQGWISSNWFELRPLIDGLARDESWVDPDQLREATELFCTLAWEHVNLATTLLERGDRDAFAA